MILNSMERDKLAQLGLSSMPKRDGNKPLEIECDHYRKGTKSFSQHVYRDGFVVWNFTTRQWDYFNEDQK